LVITSRKFLGLQLFLVGQDVVFGRTPNVLDVRPRKLELIPVTAVRAAGVGRNTSFRQMRSILFRSKIAAKLSVQLVVALQKLIPTETGFAGVTDVGMGAVFQKQENKVTMITWLVGAWAMITMTMMTTVQKSKVCTARNVPGSCATGAMSKKLEVSCDKSSSQSAKPFSSYPPANWQIRYKSK
jgi:hypothetical protein